MTGTGFSLFFIRKGKLSGCQENIQQILQHKG